MHLPERHFVVVRYNRQRENDGNINYALYGPKVCARFLSLHATAR